MRRTLIWVLSALLIAGAWLLTMQIPDDIHETDAFTAPIDAEGWARTDDLAVRVTSAAHTRALHTDSWSSDAEWVAVTVEYRALRDEQYSRGNIARAVLTIGENTYGASTRVPDHPPLDIARIGATSTVTLAFEVPDGSVVDAARLEIWDQLSYPTLGTVLVFDLDDIPVADDVAFQEEDLLW